MVLRGSDARVHYQLNNTQEAHPGHPHIHAGPDKHLQRNLEPNTNHPEGAAGAGLMSQSSTVCQPASATTHFAFHTHTTRMRAVLTKPAPQAQASSTIPLVNTTNAPRTFVKGAGYVLLRKEVIQPHLPVRLPCYDFVPIASPTFDSSPHTRWLGHWLRVLPTFVT